jgi:oligoribonuclease (3'-5' exoribonuclease)
MGVVMKELLEKKIIALLKMDLIDSSELKELVEAWEKVSEQERYDKESSYNWNSYEDLRKSVEALEGRLGEEGI